jgi:hypothetical protein
VSERSEFTNKRRGFDERRPDFSGVAIADVIVEGCA